MCNTMTDAILAKIVTIVAATVAVAACDGSDTWDPFPPDDSWEWTDLAGPDAPTPATVSNHEPLVVSGDDLLLGTADGVWRRPLVGDVAWERAGLDGLTVNALTKAADGVRIVAAGFDPRDELGPTVWYSTTGGVDWTAAALWPRGAAGEPDAGVSFPIAALEPDPVDPNVLYGGLDADSVAVTVDGGATWIMANNALSPNFGYPCVTHRPPAAAVLLQGCELPLDIAWVGARDISADDRFTLSEFRFLYGYPNLPELGNRRINSIASPSGRADRVLAGVEGGLVELTSEDDEWSKRSEIEARWIYQSDGTDANRPYAYIRAIAPLSADGRHVLFGGTLNGRNDELSLFEVTGVAAPVRRISAPVTFK